MRCPSTGCAKSSFAACSAWRRKAAQRESQPRRRAARDHEPPAVDRIADQRKAGVREVHADLVRAAGLQHHAHPGVARGSARSRGNGSRPRGRPTRTRHAQPVDADAGRSARRRCRRRSCTPMQTAWYSRWMPRAGSAATSARVQPQRARDDQEAAGVLVEPVHDAGARHLASAGSCASSAFCSVPSGLPAPGCTTRPAGLLMTMTLASSQTIDERHRLRPRRHGVLDRRIHAHQLTPGHGVAGPRDATVHADLPGIDPALQARARMLRQGSASAWSRRRPAAAGGNRNSCWYRVELMGAVGGL